MVRGSRWNQLCGRRTSHGESLVPPAMGGGSGEVRVGSWADRLRLTTRMAHWQWPREGPSSALMIRSGPPQSATRFTTLIGGTLLGSRLVAAGLLASYLTVATPLVSTLIPAAPSGGGHMTIGLGAWSLALIACGAMLVAGTTRLATIVTMVRHGARGRGAAARALASVPNEVDVVAGVVPRYGPAIPELLIGMFGAVVVHELPSASRVRQGRTGWESRTNGVWQPMEDPLDTAMRDVERVRRWLSAADLDFVVRVYGALVVNDRTVQRSPACAVIGAEQIPAWIASLPRQRSLTEGRRKRLLAMARPQASAPTRLRSPDW